MVEDEEEDFVDAEEGEDFVYEVADRDDASTPTPETGVPSSEPYPQKEGDYAPGDEGQYVPGEEFYPTEQQEMYINQNASPFSEGGQPQDTFSHDEDISEQLPAGHSQPQSSEQSDSYDGLSYSERIIEHNLSESLSCSEPRESASDQPSRNTVPIDIVGSLASLDISAAVITADYVSSSEDSGSTVEQVSSAPSNVSQGEEDSSVPNQVVCEETVPTDSESIPSADPTIAASSFPEEVKSDSVVLTEATCVDQCALSSSDQGEPSSVEDNAVPSEESSDIFQEVTPFEASPVSPDTEAPSTAEVASYSEHLPAENKTDECETSKKDDKVDITSESPTSDKKEEENETLKGSSDISPEASVE